MQLNIYIPQYLLHFRINRVCTSVRRIRERKLEDEQFSLNSFKQLVNQGMSAMISGGESVTTAACGGVGGAKAFLTEFPSSYSLSSV